MLTTKDVAANTLRAKVAKDQKSNPWPEPHIKRVTATGLVEIEFSKEMLEIPPGLQLKDLEYKISRFEWAPVMTVKVIPAPSQNPDLLGFDWSIIYYVGKRMVI